MCDIHVWSLFRLKLKDGPLSLCELCNHAHTIIDATCFNQQRNDTLLKNVHINYLQNLSLL